MDPLFLMVILVAAIFLSSAAEYACPAERRQGTLQFLKSLNCAITQEQNPIVV
jgi:hypothetical protein